MPLITRAEIAAELKVTPRTIQNLEKRGLPFSKVGDSPRYDLPEVRLWLKQSPFGRVVTDLLKMTAPERKALREILDAIDQTQAKG